MLPVERLPWNEASAFAFVYTLVIFALIDNTAFSLFYSTARRFSGGSTSRMRRMTRLPMPAPSCRLTRPWWKKLSGRAGDHLVIASLEAHP